MKAIDEVKYRSQVMYLLVVACALGILIRAAYVMVIEGSKWRSMAPASVPVRKPLAPNRGDICADDGRILATSVPYYEIRFDPTVVNKEIFQKNIDSLAYCLSKFFKDGNKNYYKEKLTRARSAKHPNRHLLINKRRVNHMELKIIRQFPIFRLGQNRGGLKVEVFNKRLQPHVNLAVRTIGYLNESASGIREGRVGLEAAFENELKGVEGQGIKRMMSGSKIILPEREPIDGNDIVTTIDVDYQDIVQHALKKQLEKSNATHGSAILMEVKTGDIKAIANLAKGPGGQYIESQNFAISGAGEPGSVIKAASFIALLEDGIVTPDDTIDLGHTGRYLFKNTELREAHGGLGKVTVQQMLEKSANGIAKLVYDNYKDRPKKFVDRWYSMGLNKKTGICLPGEAEPFIKYPSDKTWSGISLPWMAFGYESKLTPLQILAFYNAIANDGQRMRPRLVKEVRSHGQLVESFDTEEIGGRICSRKSLAGIRRMLEGVVENGTAKNIYTTKYRIAGKTGTSRIARTNGGGYVPHSYRASFVGYFPADKPLYSCIVVIDNPRNGYYATTVSAPVFREISDKVYSMAYLKYGEPEYEVDKSLPVCKNGLKEDFKVILDELDIDIDGLGDADETDWVVTASNEGENIVVKPRVVNFTTVPNVKGMGLRDALFLLENSGLKVGVVGSGMVQSQSLQPGKEVPRGSYVHIELR